jgi:hypothetical protein
MAGIRERDKGPESRYLLWEPRTIFVLCSQYVLFL